MVGGYYCIRKPLSWYNCAVDDRVPWDQYFMNIAQVVASRSTCPRKFVGSVIVRDRTILSTGYNGSIRGMPHCTDHGHMMENDHCVATIHAEANAIIQSAKNGVMIDGATIYVTASPCWNCFKQIANAGIRRIVYGEFYRDERIFSVAERLAIDLMHLPSHVPPSVR
jgi:dCMP deaminase